MNYITRLALGTSLFALSISSALSQTAATASSPTAPSLSQPIVGCSARLRPVLRMGFPGPTAPYSAEQEMSTIRTLADGTHITHKPRTEKQFRDSQGRARTERSMCGRPSEEPDAVIIEIYDPVAGYSYLLDAQNQVAHRYVLEVREHGPIQPLSSSTMTVTSATEGSSSSTIVSGLAPTPRTLPGAQDKPRPTFTTERLGTRVIEGVVAEGTKTTEVIPVGMQDNDGPITVVTERWFSSQLKLAIFTKRLDPRGGEMIDRLINISLSEPDPTLFAPPADYKMVDETEAVKIIFTRP